MNWIEIKDSNQLDEINNLSFNVPIVIFKHSTRCSISDIAKGRLDRANAPENARFYLLDLLKHRDISNLISETYHVPHESPQVLIIKNGECTYDESHTGIFMDAIVEQL